MPDKKQHLLIMRLSAMGDVAMCVPVLKSLRKANPDLKITVLTNPFFKPFFRDVAKMGAKRGDCDESQTALDGCGVDFLEPDFKGRHKGLAGLIRLYRDIRAYGVTDVADVHDVIRTKVLRPLLRLSGCKVSVIDKKRDKKRELTRKHQKIVKQITPSIECYKETIERLGFEVPELKPEKRVVRAIPEPILKITGQKSGVWVGVAPFAQHQGKIYPVSQTNELIELLSKQYEYVFVFGGGSYEKEFAEVMEQRNNRVVSVIGRIKLGAELDLISNLDAIVTMDSAAMHMASLVGVPAVSVWGATHPYAGFYGFGQDPSNAVQVDMPCRPCSVYGNKPCMFKDYRCMLKVTPAMICERVDSVVKAGTEKL